MSRRLFLQSLTALFGGFALPALTQAKPAAKQWKTLQISSVAGFQYHRGETMSALIIGLKKSNNPWERIEVEVEVEVEVRWKV